MLSFLYNSQRWAWFKYEWTAGNYFKAIMSLLNGLPNVFYPGGEAAYYAQIAQYQALYPDLGADDLRAWKIFFWRQLFHFLGGVALGALNVPFWLNLPKKYQAILPILTFIGFLVKELTLDASERGKIAPKEFIDALAWALGACIWLLF